MAERRMFTKKITDSDAFLDMPLSAQALYFHINMAADDEGFVNNPKKIQRMVGASEDDYKILIGKKFLIAYDTGVIVIKHWKMHNYIQKDRFHPTVYQDEKSMLVVKKNGAYTLIDECMDTQCIQNGYKMDTEVRLGKDSIDNNILSDKSDELLRSFEELYKKYLTVHKSYNGKGKAKTKYIKWCTTGCKVNGKTVKLTPQQIESGIFNYVQDHYDKEAKNEWVPEFKNIDTLMNQILDWIGEEV